MILSSVRINALSYPALPSQQYIHFSPSILQGSSDRVPVELVRCFEQQTVWFHSAEPQRDVVSVCHQGGVQPDPDEVIAVKRHQRGF